MDPLYLTIDIDWAPDFMIQGMADVLVEYGMRATWFVTHDTPLLGDLSAEPLFELGIHPNIAASSTQGGDEREIFGRLMELVPDAVCVRTHGNVQSTNLTIRMSRDYKMRVDASYFLPREPVKPHYVRWVETEILRVPYDWEDAYEASQSDSEWSLDEGHLAKPGMHVINFHPVHWYLNTQDYRTYARAKDLGPVQAWTPGLIADLIAAGQGPREFLTRLSIDGATRSRKLCDLLVTSGV